MALNVWNSIVSDHHVPTPTPTTTIYGQLCASTSPVPSVGLHFQINFQLQSWSCPRREIFSHYDYYHFGYYSLGRQKLIEESNKSQLRIAVSDLFHPAQKCVPRNKSPARPATDSPPRLFTSANPAASLTTASSAGLWSSTSTNAIHANSSLQEV